MSEPGTQRKRRRRRRAGAPQGPVPTPPAVPAQPAEPAGPASQGADPAAARGSVKRRKPPKEKTAAATDRGMRELVGPGRSALGVGGALRGRDVNRPTEADLAEAEREVSIVRRNWRPPAEKG